MTTAHQQTNATRFLLNEATSNVKHIHQLRLNAEYESNRFRAGLTIQHQKVRKISESRRHVIEDLAILLSDTMMHNAHVTDKPLQVTHSLQSNHNHPKILARIG